MWREGWHTPLFSITILTVKNRNIEIKLCILKHFFTFNDCHGWASCLCNLIVVVVSFVSRWLLSRFVFISMLLICVLYYLRTAVVVTDKLYGRCNTDTCQLLVAKHFMIHSHNIIIWKKSKGKTRGDSGVPWLAAFSSISRKLLYLTWFSPR